MSKRHSVIIRNTRICYCRMIALINKGAFYMDQNELKSLVGRAAVKYIKDGMIVGLGTGSTVRYMVDALG